MKNIDIKSLLIGVLATALLFACADADKTLPSIVSEAKAATGVNDKWDVNQEWRSVGGGTVHEGPKGYEPFAVAKNGNLLYRKRTK